MRRFALRLLATAALAATVVAPAAAQTLTGRQAQQATFAPRGQMEGVVIPHPSLTPAEVSLLQRAVPEGILGQMAYYGALAIAPDAGLADQATVRAVGNYHDQASADRAALAQCNAARSGGAGCVVVLQVRPQGYRPGAALELSSEATQALRGDYRRFGSPRVMAISRATGRFGIGSTVENAVAACGSQDCRAVVADR